MSVITFQNVTKKFKITHKRNTLFNVFQTKQKIKTITALKHINFSIKKGEIVGVIGDNGSGKSTILKLISGILVPTSGNIFINGKIASLIELGAGFHPDLTGKENLMLNALLLGMSKHEIQTKYQDILDFADIGNFINLPIRTYSSGMLVRLGFAIAIHADPDILLIDEVLAVGDAEFQKKSINKINELRKEDKTILLVSHNMIHILELCKKVILLKHGEIVAVDTPPKILSLYRNLISKKNTAKKTISSDILRVRSISTVTKKTDQANSFIVNVSYTVVKPIEELNCSIGIYTHISESPSPVYCGGLSTKHTYIKLNTKSGKIKLEIPFFPFQEGKYFINVSLFGDTESFPYVFVGNASEFWIKNGRDIRGLVHLDGIWKQT